MNCEQMQKLLSPYLDKMTTYTENQTIEAHLKECGHCAHQLEEMSHMCAMLKKLDTPQVPAGFGADLHNRINHEKIKHFPSREAAVPKKTGWLAAAVAGIALSVGIFASSFLPYGAMMASLQDWMGKDNKSPVAVVDNNKIIQNWINKQLALDNTENNSEIINPGQSNGKINDPTKPSDSTGIWSPTSNPVEVALQERVGQNYTAKMQVDNMEKSMQDVMQMAYASGAQIGIKSANVMSATAEQVKVVTLEVPKDKANQLLSELGTIGIEAPLQNNVTYTQAYNDNQKELASVETDIEKLQSSNSLSEQQQTQLQSLLKQKQDLQAEQTRIDKEADYVTIEVRMVEKTDS